MIETPEAVDAGLALSGVIVKVNIAMSAQWQ